MRPGRGGGKRRRAESWIGFKGVLFGGFSRVFLGFWFQKDCQKVFFLGEKMAGFFDGFLGGEKGVPEL